MVRLFSIVVSVGLAIPAFAKTSSQLPAHVMAMPQPASGTAYQILQIPPSATSAEIRRAYLQRSRNLMTSEGRASDQLVVLQEAYAKISTPERRAAYDYRQNLGPRPASFSKTLPLVQVDLSNVLANSTAYQAALRSFPTDDPILHQSLKRWARFPKAMRTELLNWLGAGTRGAYAFQMLLPTFAILFSQTQNQLMVWSTLLGAFATYPNFTVIAHYLTNKPYPKALFKESVNEIGLASGPLVGSLIAFDLTEITLGQAIQHRFQKFGLEYQQLRLDRMAKAVPALAIGQLLRFLHKDAEGIPNAWEDVFRKELRSRPKYWRAQLEILTPLLKANAKAQYLVVYAQELDEELAKIAPKQAVMARLGLHIKRTCEAALQFPGALLSK